MKKPTYEELKEEESYYFWEGILIGTFVVGLITIGLLYFYPEKTFVFKDGKEAGYKQCMNESDYFTPSWNLTTYPINASADLVIINGDGKQTEISNTCEGNQTLKINSTFIGCEKENSK